VEAFAIALAVVFVAELGDKTQLVVLTMGARHRPAAVLAGLALTAAVLMGLAVTVGAAVGAALPDRAVEVFAGLLFLGFAVWTWRTADEPAHDQDDLDVAEHAGTRGLLGFLGAFFLAELGDKTQLTAASLAADHGVVGTWLGATLGLFAASALALVAGRFLIDRISRRTLSRIGAVAFALVGVLTLASAAVD
jgi:putative Ca2+/H+ antiporter (TMEM165/GDT1 family)